ncbi:MAG: ABC transporter ATP-binding protein [Bulleidia sp.]
MKTENRKPSVWTYIQKEIPLLVGITISGLIYNIGLSAGPYFEGQLAQNLADILAGKSLPIQMAKTAVVYIAVIMSVQGCRFIKRLLVRYFANHINRNMKVTLYRDLISQPLHNHAGDTGGLLSRAVSDVDDCVEGIRKFTTEIFDTGIVMITYTMMLALYDWKLTCMAMLWPPLAFLCADRMKKTVTTKEKKARESRDNTNRVLLDRVSNALTYRRAGAQQQTRETMEKAFENMERTQRTAVFFQQGVSPLYRAVSLFGMIPIFLYGTHLVFMHVWDIAAFTAYVSCYTKLSTKASKSAALFNAVTKARVSWNRISPYLHETDDTRHTVDTVRIMHVDVDNAGYEHNRPVLHDIHFTAYKGQMIGITGQVASGKSLLASVMAGRIACDGCVTVDGHPVENVQACAWCANRPEIFNDTIENNITLGNGGDVKPFMHDVCLDEEMTPDKQAGEMGSELSGGQQSRLALARALYSDLPVLILDDPFAPVDTAMEKQIIQTLKTEYSDRIIVIFSHRLDCFDQMDQVILLKDGSAVSGTHASLLETQPLYHSLVYRQKGSDDHA